MDTEAPKRTTLPRKKRFANYFVIIKQQSVSLKIQFNMTALNMLKSIDIS